MTAVDNEKLCALAQNGDMDALNSLVENNLRFIKMAAHEIWSAQIEVNRALGVTFDDLVQEGCLGLMGCVEKFNPDGGNKFLTYAAPAIRNSMIDYIRSQSTSFEAKHMGEIVSLDEVMKFENRDRHAFIPDSNMTNPAQIYIAKETHEELHAALDAISNREREYLLYRFGFEDDMEHPLTETAEHFFLSESRAKSTEKLALITYSWSCHGGFTDGRDGRCGGFYIPLAPPLAQKIFPHSFKISYANYTRTGGFCSLQIPCLL